MAGQDEFPHHGQVALERVLFLWAPTFVNRVCRLVLGQDLISYVHAVGFNGIAQDLHQFGIPINPLGSASLAIALLTSDLYGPISGLDRCF